MRFVKRPALDAEVTAAQERIVYWIRHHLDARDASRAELVRYCGLSTQGMHYLVNGEREPGLRTLVRVAMALEVDVLDLLQPIPDDAV